MHEAYSEEERKPVMCTQLNESFIRLLLHSLCLHSLVSDMYFYATLCLFSDSTMFFNLTFVLGPAVQFSLALNVIFFFSHYTSPLITRKLNQNQTRKQASWMIYARSAREQSMQGWYCTQNIMVHKMYVFVSLFLSLFCAI